MTRLLTLLLFGLGLSSNARADFVSGTVVDANGQPVAGVNITARSLGGGGDGHLANAGTNAAGVFNVSIDPGVYDFTFEPPAPPAAVAMITEVENIVASGSVSIGTVTLDPAIHLQGRLIRAGNIPVQGVNLDVVELASGDNIDLIGDASDALGEFHIAAPIGQLELYFNTTPVLTPLLAPTFRELDATTDIDLGDILLDPGFRVSAVLVNPNFLGVFNVDADVVDIQTGRKLYTPGDNSDVNGLLDFVVPAGTYDVEFCPQFASSLVAELVPSLNVSATTNLGLITLASGFRLSGLVTSYLGAPVPGTDVDARNSITGESIQLCGDDTNASGAYQVIVPPGPVDLTFTPPGHEKLGSAFTTNLMIAGNSVSSAVLPFCDCGGPSGVGVPGSGGITPVITATGGGMRLGSNGWSFEVTNGLGGSIGAAVVGYGPSCGSKLPAAGLLGPLQLSSRSRRIISFQLDGAPGLPGVGSVQMPMDLPIDPSLSGYYLSLRGFVLDAGAVSGRSSTPVLCGVLCQ